MINFVEIGTVLAAPLVRNLVGWGTTYLSDGKFDQYDAKKLVETVVKTLTITAFAYYGFNGFGIDVDAASVAFSVVVVDMIISQIKKPKITAKKK